MTKSEAKLLAQSKLRYYTLILFPDRKIENLPRLIRNKVKKLHNHCPLCELFVAEKIKNKSNCYGCPLDTSICNDRSNEGLRKCLEKLNAWEVENEL